MAGKIDNIYSGIRLIPELKGLEIQDKLGDQIVNQTSYAVRSKIIEGLYFPLKDSLEEILHKIIN